MTGLSEIQAAKQLLGLHNAYKRDPVGYIRHLVRANNLTAEALFGQADPNSDVESDPEIEALKSQIQQLTGYIQQSAQAQQQAKTAELHSTIQAFASAKDEAGNLKHPHYEKLKPRMAALLTSKQARSLDEAYEMASWADADVRKSLIERAKAPVNNQAAVEKAKRAATPKSEGGQTAAVPPKGLDGHLARALDAAGFE